MKPILEANGLSKRYKIQNDRTKYLSMREQLSDKVKIALGGSKKENFFWALKDLNFKIFEGECVGIIGRNGAGKSTLLKVLSRITPPTKGYVKARGKVASLLEVGTGFHFELTGRENIFLNGSILGLKKQTIIERFDEIVDFSGVEPFLDTPLKHFSSGMQLRLAFAVAAHLNPEILLIDEVLAVGDVAFQKKCIGKMSEVSRSGRTIIFVSHQLDLVRQICSKGIVLDQGEIIFNGEINKGIDYYLSKNITKPGSIHWSLENAIGKEELKILSIQLLDTKGRNKALFDYTENIHIEIRYFLSSALKSMRLNLQVLTYNETIVFATSSQNFEPIEKKKGYYQANLVLPSHFFNAQEYKIALHSDCVNYKILLPQTVCVDFEVIHSKPMNVPKQLLGITSPDVQWEIQTSI
ncbi:MAG: ABC transporter ATP-binding protein [Bacteroidota bacterium]